MNKSTCRMSLLVIALLVETCSCAGQPTAGSSLATTTGLSALVPGTATGSVTAAPSITVAQPADALVDGLAISASIGGGPQTKMTVDTGSTGVVIARRFVGAAALSLDPVQKFTGFTYSSSGDTYDGEWMSASIQLGAVNGTADLATTAQIMVRVVDEECVAGLCGSDASTIAVAMFGVGFDRGAPTATDPAAGPEINPFLNLQQMISGSMPRAYLISKQQIILGPTAADRAGMQTIQLATAVPATAVPATAGAVDWQPASSCVAVPSGGVPPQCGTLLLDTGLSYAIMQVPAGVDPPLGAATPGERPPVSDGQQVQITATGLTEPVYAFTVGAAGAPTSVQWGHTLTDGKSFMNISRYALAQQDYLYDAGAGQVGFRAHS